jgi:hypothetical protein
MSSWAFLSHHAHVLLCSSRDPDARLRGEISSAVDITERAVQAIVNDLDNEGYVERTRVGRRNHHSVNTTAPLRHRAPARLDAGALLRLMG